jgi:hypothetical protein
MEILTAKKKSRQRVKWIDEISNLSPRTPHPLEEIFKWINELSDDESQTLHEYYCRRHELESLENEQDKISKLEFHIDTTKLKKLKCDDTEDIVSFKNRTIDDFFMYDWFIMVETDTHDYKIECCVRKLNENELSLSCRDLEIKIGSRTTISILFETEQTSYCVCEQFFDKEEIDEEKLIEEQTELKWKKGKIHTKDFFTGIIYDISIREQSF